MLAPATQQISGRSCLGLSVKYLGGDLQGNSTEFHSSLPTQISYRSLSTRLFHTPKDPFSAVTSSQKFNTLFCCWLEQLRTLFLFNVRGTEVVFLLRSCESHRFALCLQIAHSVPFRTPNARCTSATQNPAELRWAHLHALSLYHHSNQIAVPVHVPSEPMFKEQIWTTVASALGKFSAPKGNRKPLLALATRARSRSSLPALDQGFTRTETPTRVRAACCAWDLIVAFKSLHVHCCLH